jgi:Immunity protein family (Imm11)
MSYRTLDARVWATNCLTDGELIYGFRSDKSLEDEERAADTMSRAERGEPQPADHFPKEMYVASEFEKIKTVPDIFTSGFWVVSARFAEVLRRFELGQTGLYPVKLFHHDRKTPFEGEYFVLAFGETKDTFVPEESPEADTVFMRKDVWQAKRANNKDSLAFDKSVLNGVDLWMETKIMHSFFMSDRLVEALKAEKLTKPLKPYRCRIVSNLH